MQTKNARAMDSIDEKRKAKPSALATVIFLLLFTGPPKFRFRDPEASLSAEVDLAALVQVIIWCLAGLWCLWKFFNLNSRSKNQFWATYRNTLFFVGAIVVSVFVSVGPLLTAFKAFQVIVMVVFCYVFTKEYGADAGLRRLLAGNLLLCALIVLFAMTAPELILFDSETGAQRLTGRGIAEAGITGAFAVILLVALRPRIGWLMRVLLIASLIYFTFLTLMRTAYIVVLIFFFMLILRSQATRQSWSPVMLALIILGVAVVLAMSVDFSYYRDPESIYTLSDRVGLWSHYIDNVLSRSPILGFGFVSGSRVLGLEYNPRLGNAHSIFFEAFVGAGFLGLLLFLTLFLGLLKDAYRLFLKGTNTRSFAVSSLFMAVSIIGLIGGELDVGQVGFTFWYLSMVIPSMRQGAGEISSSRSVCKGQ